MPDLCPGPNLIVGLPNPAQPAPPSMSFRPALRIAANSFNQVTQARPLARFALSRAPARASFIPSLVARRCKLLGPLRLSPSRPF